MSFFPLQQGLQRSSLHTQENLYWLQSRHKETVKQAYGFLPAQIVIEIKNLLTIFQHHVQTIDRLFDQFDKDGSKSLDKLELYNIFSKYSIQITMEELQTFFNIVDKNHDQSLTLQEFKACIQNEQAKNYFMKIIENVRQRELIINEQFNSQQPSEEQQQKKEYQTKQDQENQNIIQETQSNQRISPLRTFTKVLNQLAYHEQREYLIKVLNQNKEPLRNRFTSLFEIVNLNKEVKVELQYRENPNLKQKTKNSEKMSLQKELMNLVNQAKKRGQEGALDQIKLDGNKFSSTQMLKRMISLGHLGMDKSNSQKDGQNQVNNTSKKSDKALFCTRNKQTVSPRLLVLQNRKIVQFQRPNYKEFISQKKTRLQSIHNRIQEHVSDFMKIKKVVNKEIINDGQLVQEQFNLKQGLLKTCNNFVVIQPTDNTTNGYFFKQIQQRQHQVTKDDCNSKSTRIGQRNQTEPMDQRFQFQETYLFQPQMKRKLTLLTNRQEKTNSYTSNNSTDYFLRSSDNYHNKKKNLANKNQHQSGREQQSFPPLAQN